MDDISLVDCPSEILHLVFEQLQISDFYALCLVCRRLRQCAEPFLYRQINWTWTFGWSLDGNPRPANQRIPPIVPFLRTISRRPQLAAFIREFELEGDSLSRIAHYYRNSPPVLPCFEDIDTLVARVPDLDMAEEDKALLTKELREGAMEAFVALVLAQAPDLKRLRLGENLLRDSFFVDKLLARAVSMNGCPRLFQNVSEVHFALSNDMRYRVNSRNTAAYLRLFYLPSIERLTVSIDNPHKPFQWPLTQPPSPSRLTYLDLGMLREDHLGKVLAATPNLKTLRWGWVHADTIQDRFVSPCIDLDKIAADLSHVRRTLTSLTVTAETEPSGGESLVVWVKGSLAPLATLEALTSLHLPLPFLAGSLSLLEAHPLGPWLPGNLENLTVTDDLCLQEEWQWSGEGWYEFFNPWVEEHTWKAFAPHLRRLHFILNAGEEAFEDLQLTAQMVERGWRAGLEVDITRP
ncbi:hypothetical protein NKR19_g5453 [Coniochaeta hoffmannii]|uniref:F-box domain-containing protein n=1 Tax=Coniochaeta hoffmannii TaxID=91930 RepID=A0AA38RJX4_9PEZI|nr:hypothetical protein NKR19_g5453 [Coniochaeta hoffmannii]